MLEGLKHEFNEMWPGCLFWGGAILFCIAIWSFVIYMLVSWL